MRSKLSRRVTGKVLAAPKAEPGGLVTASTASTPMLFTVVRSAQAATKVPAASATTLSLLTESLVRTAGVPQMLPPAGSRVASSVLTGWPSALVVLPSHKTDIARAVDRGAAGVEPAARRRPAGRASACCAHGGDHPARREADPGGAARRHGRRVRPPRRGHEGDLGRRSCRGPRADRDRLGGMSMPGSGPCQQSG